MDPHLLQRRYEREKAARQQAESLLEVKSFELYQANGELKRMADEVAAQSSQLNAILDRSLAAFLLVDADGAIIRVNRMTEVSFGADAQALTGRPVASLFAEDCRKDAEALIQAAVTDLAAYADDDNERDVSSELTGRAADGRTFPVEIGVSRLEHAGQVHTVWICRDITKRRKAEAKRQVLEQELRQAQKLESLGTLASGIAHEINTPVQFISDNIHFLKDMMADLEQVFATHAKAMTALEAAGGVAVLAEVKAAEDDADLEFLMEEAPRCIEQSLDGVKRIGKIVGAIKEFAHPGTDEKTAIDLNKALKTTATVCRNQWKYVAELDFDLADDLPKVMGHPGDINQVLLNLIVNAAHAIEEVPGDALGKIRIATRSDADRVVLTVADTGCGIPKENLEKIYDPFFTTKGVGKGTGQGLAITHNIVVAKHGGAIDIDSEIGNGTTFRISLPIEATRQREAA